MTRERELLLAACRPTPDAESTERLRELVSGALDWGLLSRAAIGHGVAALVFHRLTQRELLPAGDGRLSALRSRFFANSANSVALARELEDLLACFDAAGIAAVPYKGPAVATTLYGNLLLREFTDLDVLIREDDAINARHALMANGYEPERVLTRQQEAAARRTTGEYRFRFDRSLPAGRVALELHWRIPGTLKFDDDAIWDRLQETQLLNRTCRQFAPEDLLLILSVHGLQHAWNTLKWIVDIAHLLDAPPAVNINWPLAIAEARRVGGLRVLLVGCALARSLLGAPLPPDVVERTESDSIVSSRAKLFRDRLFDRPIRRVGVFNHLRMLDGGSARIRYGVSLLGHLSHPVRLAGRLMGY